LVESPPSKGESSIPEHAGRWKKARPASAFLKKRGRRREAEGEEYLRHCGVALGKKTARRNAKRH